MKTISAILAIALTGCTTTVVTQQDAKGAIVTTRTTSPPTGLVTALGVAIGGVLDTAINGLIANQQ